MLANGSGGIDWAGFPYACAVYGAGDVDMLIRRINFIRGYRPQRE